MFDRNVIQNRSKNEVETRLACVIDFGLIFGPFWSHFGIENRSKIDQRTELESNAKQEATRTAKEAPKGGMEHGLVRVSRRGWGRGGNLRRGETVKASLQNYRFTGLQDTRIARTARMTELTPGIAR